MTNFKYQILNIIFLLLSAQIIFAGEKMIVEKFDLAQNKRFSPLPMVETKWSPAKDYNNIWSFSCGPTNPSLWKITLKSDKIQNYLSFDWDNKNETWLSAVVNFKSPVQYKNKRALSFRFRSKKYVSLELSVSTPKSVFSTSIDNINSHGNWTNIFVQFDKMFVPDWYKKENKNKKIPKKIPKSGYINAIAIAPLWNTCGQCDIDDITLEEGEKALATNPYLIENFKNYSAAKFNANPSNKPSHFSDDKKWIFDAGPKAPIKWNVDFVKRKRRNRTFNYLHFDWNNKNATWLSATCYFKCPEKLPHCNALSFSAHTDSKQKIDITISLADKTETPFQFSAKLNADKKGWSNIIVPFDKLNIPKWFSGTNETKYPDGKFPTNGIIRGISISPAWNSKGILDIDNIVWTNINTFVAKSFSLKQKNKLNRLDKIKNYACFYGANKIEEMSQFDAVIFEPKQHSKENIKRLKKSGTFTIGYITIGEDDELNKNVNWYFDRNKDGKPDKNGIWNSWYADARSKDWRDYVVYKKAKAVLVDKKCDGIFLDTVDTTQLYGESRDGMIQLIKELRETYPKAIIVQNRGFSVIEDTAKYIDGLMYEAFSVHYKFADEEYDKLSDSDLRWSKQMAENTLAPIMKKTGLVVLSLDYAEPEQKELIQFSYDRAKHFGFVHYLSTISLQDIFVRNVKPKPYSGPDLEEKIMPPKNPAHGNLCRNDNVTINVDSTFQGYSSKAVVDGYRQEKELEWYERAWASDNRSGEHFLKIDFGATQTISKIIIYWSIENSKPMASELVKVFADKENKPIAEITSEKGATKSEIIFPKPVSVKKLIFRQPDGKGPKSEPNIMWISEIEVYGVK